MPRTLPDELRRTSAQRAKDWRDVKRAAGEKPRSGPSGKSGKSAPKFDKIEFVAIDGEGFSEGDEKSWRLGTDKKLYTGKPHYYAYLSASDGTELLAHKGRLSTQQCLDFLLDIMDANKRAVIVVFGGSYDTMQMLYDLNLEQIKTLLGKDENKTGRLDITLGGTDYRLEIRPRKTFTVRAWPKGSPKYDLTKKGVYTLTKHRKAVVWDVWGFFQDSFAGVMRKWIPDHPDYQFILRMKGERAIFHRSEIKEIQRYNAAELRCLVAVMDKLREAVAHLGLKLTRWDGAGAIAGAILRLQGVKEHKADTPPHVFDAARHAYSGGHIEAMQIGHYDGPVYHYDLNSAYPAMFAELPSLNSGVWISGTGEPPPGFTLVHTRWSYNYGNPFYPLFFREEDGSIVYPREGEGWHWHCEWKNGLDYFQQIGGDYFEVIEWHHFKESRRVRPFGWISEYYAERQSRIEAAKKMGVEDGPEKIIKLGLNSLYGKTAQQLGARPDETGKIQPPPYFQLEWAGAVTAGCRAGIMAAAIQNPISIISIATDGIFSTQPLDLDAPKQKELGKWEAQTHSGITVVMPGVYWLHEQVSPPVHYSRGFDKKAMSDPEFIRAAWRKKMDRCEVSLTRMIGLGSACHGGAHFEMRGMFVTSTRSLALNGNNSKRYPVTLARVRPERELVPTSPRERETLSISAPFDVSWLGSDFEDEREAIDAELA